MNTKYLALLGGAAVTVILVWPLWLMHSYNQQQELARVSFMHECLQEHKQYECTAMWRGKVTP